MHDSVDLDLRSAVAIPDWHAIAIPDGIPAWHALGDAHTHAIQVALKIKHSDVDWHALGDALDHPGEHSEHFELRDGEPYADTERNRIALGVADSRTNAIVEWNAIFKWIHNPVINTDAVAERLFFRGGDWDADIEPKPYALHVRDAK